MRNSCRRFASALAMLFSRRNIFFFQARIVQRQYKHEHIGIIILDTLIPGARHLTHLLLEAAGQRLPLCLWPFMDAQTHAHTHTNTNTHTHAHTHTRRTHTHTCTHTHTHAHANARYETQKQAKGDQHKIHCHRLNLRKKQTLKYAHANARNFALSHPLALSLTLVLSHTHHIILHASPTVSIFVRWRLMTPLSKSEKRLLIVLAKSMLQVWSVSNRVREHEFVFVTQRVL